MYLRYLLFFFRLLIGILIKIFGAENINRWRRRRLYKAGLDRISGKWTVRSVSVKFPPDFIVWMHWISGRWTVWLLSVKFPPNFMVLMHRISGKWTICSCFGPAIWNLSGQTLVWSAKITNHLYQFISRWCFKSKDKCDFFFFKRILVVRLYYRFII